MRHGAKRKTCSYEGCTKGAIEGGVCMSHGGGVKLCSLEGCTNKGGECIKTKTSLMNEVIL